jgi:tetratricopeptide (TPR) repeat protein
MKSAKSFVAFCIILTGMQIIKAQAPEVTIKTATGYYNRAMAEFGYNNIDAAMQNLDKAIELKPDYADALSYRGYFYNMKQQYDKAIADYQAAEKLKKNVNGYYIACPFALKGNKEEAFKWIEAALTAAENKPLISAIINDKELDNLHSDPRWNTLISKDWYSAYEKLVNEGNKKTADKDLPGALECWNKAVALEPKNDVAYGQRAINYIYQGNFEKALADVNEAIRLKPDNSTYFGNRAYIYKELKRNNEALADYNKAIQLDPQNMVYADRAVVKESVNSKDASAADDLKTHIDSYYKDDYNIFYLASYYYMMDNMSEAIKYLDKAVAANQSEFQYYKLRAKAYMISKNHAKAISDFSAAISLNPKDGESYYSRGVCKAEQLDKAGACTDWRAAENAGYADPNGYIKSLCK